MIRTQSAGGIVINGGKLLLVDEGDGFLGFPKGRIKSGEEPLAAAKREIYEESGVQSLTLLGDLGAYQRYPYINGKEDRSEHKTIRLFAFKTADMPLDNPEKNNLVWVIADKAAGLLTHPEDQKFLKNNLDTILDLAGVLQ